MDKNQSWEFERYLNQYMYGATTIMFYWWVTKIKTMASQRTYLFGIFLTLYSMARLIHHGKILVNFIGSVTIGDSTRDQQQPKHLVKYKAVLNKILLPVKILFKQEMRKVEKEIQKIELVILSGKEVFVDFNITLSERSQSHLVNHLLWYDFENDE